MIISQKRVESSIFPDFFEILDNIFNCQGAYIKQALIELRF